MTIKLIIVFIILLAFANQSRCISCPSGKTYYVGCQEKCTDGSSFICPTKTLGCWCPVGESENAEGECIPLHDCDCAVGSKIYTPGQTVIRSICETCTCYAGSMLCFAVCYL